MTAASTAGHDCDRLDCSPVARRTHAERMAQGLPAVCSDPVVLSRLAVLVRPAMRRVAAS